MAKFLVAPPSTRENPALLLSWRQSPIWQYRECSHREASLAAGYFMNQRWRGGSVKMRGKPLAVFRRGCLPRLEPPWAELCNPSLPFRVRFNEFFR